MRKEIKILNKLDLLLFLVAQGCLEGSNPLAHEVILAQRRPWAKIVW